MSLRPRPIGPVPEQTAQVAHAAFPKGNPYLTLRDHLGTIFQDEDFTTLFPTWGYPGLPPWRLALVTLMQFREHLADRQAAEAVRARIDWKYLLGLDLTDPGFDFSVLSEFRDRLLAGSAEGLLLDKLLERCRTMGLLTARGQQRTDSTHVLAAIRVMNRLELVAETLRATLNALATVAPAWLQAWRPSRGMSAMASGSRIRDCRKGRPTAMSTPRRWERMGLPYSTPSKRPRCPRACGNSRASPRCAKRGSAIMSAYRRPALGSLPLRAACASRRTGTYHARLKGLNRLTMWTRATATNTVRPGPGIWCMSAKRVTRLTRIC